MDEYIKLLEKETQMLKEELTKLDKQSYDNNKKMLDDFAKMQIISNEIENLNSKFFDAKVSHILPYLVVPVFIVSIITFIISNGIGNDIYASIFNYAVLSGLIFGAGEGIIYKIFESKIENYLLKRFPSLKKIFDNIKDKKEEYEKTENSFSLARKNVDIYKADYEKIKEVYKNKKIVLEDAIDYYNKMTNINYPASEEKKEAKVRVRIL